MRSLLLIAVLECDEPVGERENKYGGFINLLRELLEAGALRLAESGSHEQPKLDISRYDMLNRISYPELDSVDAVLLSGSNM